MKHILRLSIDNDSDYYVVDYRVRSGYYKEEIHTRRFKKLSEVIEFVMRYILE